MILAIKTNSDQSELYILDALGQIIASRLWISGRQLSQQLLLEIRDILASIKATQADLTGVIVFAGPGSFTGLRIGVTVANALAYSQQIPIAATEGEDWLSIKSLKEAKIGSYVVPEYGSEAHITKAKK